MRGTFRCLIPSNIPFDDRAGSEREVVRERGARDSERERKQRMPLFVNQSGVSERENSQQGPYPGGGYLKLLERITEPLRTTVRGGPRVAASYETNEKRGKKKTTGSLAR